ncbi:MAG: pilus assembly protein PilM [Polyangiales bacterium]
MATITLGIDIGSYSIRGTLARATLRTLNVERYIEVPLEALSADTPRDQQVLLGLRELTAQLQQQGNVPDAIVVALDGTRASLRAVEIPLAAKKKLSEVLPFELESVLPFSVDEAVIDYQEIGTRDQHLALLAAAVPAPVVADTLDQLARAEIHPRELAVGGAALDGLLHFLVASEERATLLLHFDRQAAEVCIVRGKSCELARTINEGSEGALMRPFAFRAALHQTIMKYRAEGGPPLERVIVMGEDVERPDLLGRVAEAVGMDVEVLEMPLVQGQELPPPAVFGKSLALAVRSARRGKRLDLRKDQFALPRGVSQLRDHALLAAVCALAVVLTYTFSVWAEYQALSEERDALAEKLSKVSELHFAEATRSPKRARELLEGGGQSKDPLPRFDAFRVLGAISAAFPDSIKPHDTRKLEITLDEGGQTGTFALQGQIPDLQARDEVADALDGHECFEAIERGKTSTVIGQERKNYTLEGQIACPGAKKGKAAQKRGK